MEIRIIIVDSDESLRFRLWDLLRAYRCFRLLAELETTDEAEHYLQTHEVDVVFINNQPASPERTGQGVYLPLLLEPTYPDLQVVAYSDDPLCACEAYRSVCAGFLLLPFDPLILQRTVAHLRYVFELQQRREESAHSSLMIRTRTGYDLIPTKEILFLERVNRSIRIVTQDGAQTELIGYSMKELEKMLSKRGFFRCHQSFLVNLSKVSVIRSDSESRRYAICFRGVDGEIAVSREKYMEIVSLIREKYARDG